MADKQTAQIDDWRLIAGCLWGHVRKHPKQELFNPASVQMTSQIVSLNEDTGIAETENTIYTLGTKWKEPEDA